MGKIAKLNIDGYIGQSEGFDEMFGLPSPFSLKTLSEFLDNLESDVTDIHIHINSGGGSVNEGFAIYDKLNTSPYNITTIGEGMVGSIATVVYLSGKTRKIFENSQFFIHNPYVQPFGSMESKDAQRLADELKAEEERILNFYVEKTGKKAEDIKPFMDAQTSFTSQEAIDKGFVTEIVKKETQNKKEYKLLAFTNKQINEDMKNAPMNKAEQETWFKKFDNLLNKFLGNAEEAVNAVIKTKEGTDIHFDGELKEGGKCFTDPAMTTPVIDGTYTTETQTIEVKGGVVTKLTEVVKEEEKPAAEVAALTTENEALKAEVVALKAAADLSATEALAKAQIVNAMADEIKAFKLIVIGKEETPKPSTQAFKASEKAEGRFSGIKSNLVKKYAK